MSVLLGAGDMGTFFRQAVDRPLPDFPSEAAAANAPMPTLTSTQKAVLVTVTNNGRTTTYQKTAEGLITWIQQ